MGNKYLKITSVSNEDGNDLFNAICKDVLHRKTSDLRLELGLPVAQKVTMKDCITLIQEKGLSAELIVTYDPEKKIEEPAGEKLASATGDSGATGSSENSANDDPFA